MNIFDLRNRLVGDYASYTDSFIKIADPRIRAKVESELAAGAVWPEPMLRLTPTFLPGEPPPGTKGRVSIRPVLPAEILGVYVLLPSPPHPVPGACP
jgi:hypothetical protein